MLTAENGKIPLVQTLVKKEFTHLQHFEHLFMAPATPFNILVFGDQGNQTTKIGIPLPPHASPRWHFTVYCPAFQPLIRIHEVLDRNVNRREKC